MDPHLPLLPPAFRTLTRQVMIEFSCQEEGDGDDGWHDDTEDDSDQVEMSSEQLAEQMKDEEEPEGEDAGKSLVMHYI